MCLSKIISPIQSPLSTLVVSFRVLYDVQHTHSTSRDEDILPSCKDNLWSYVDNGSWDCSFIS